MAKQLGALRSAEALPTFTLKGSLPALSRRPNLSVLAQREMLKLMKLVPDEVLATTKRLAGGGASAYPYVTGEAIKGLRAVDPKPRREGPIGIITTSAPHGKALERGAYYSNTGWRRKAGRYITKAWRRWARGGADKAAKEALDRAFDRAARRREKIDVEVKAR